MPTTATKRAPISLPPPSSSCGVDQTSQSPNISADTDHAKNAWPFQAVIRHNPTEANNAVVPYDIARSVNSSDCVASTNVESGGCNCAIVELGRALHATAFPNPAIASHASTSARS